MLSCYSIVIVGFYVNNDDDNDGDENEDNHEHDDNDAMFYRQWR